MSIYLLTLKALHVIFLVTWFAGLFYLPRLYVYHAASTDEISLERFKIMERKLFWGIMTPSAVLALAFGITLWLHYAYYGGWLQIKIALTTLLVLYHVWCGKLMLEFKHGRNRHSHVWFRWFNEAPVLILVVNVFMAIVKPF